LKRRDVSFEEIVVKRGNHRIEWEWIGEGNSGDYDPADPEDVPLLRFTVSDYTRGFWNQLDDGSYCTHLPVSTPVCHLVRAAVSILEAAEQPLPKKRFEELSWFNPSDFETSEDMEKVRQGLMQSQGAYDALKSIGAHKHLPGYDGCLERLKEAQEALERLGRVL
jgi:hypothetical protein